MEEATSTPSSPCKLLTKATQTYEPMATNDSESLGSWPQNCGKLNFCLRSCPVTLVERYIPLGVDSIARSRTPNKAGKTEH